MLTKITSMIVFLMMLVLLLIAGSLAPEYAAPAQQKVVVTYMPSSADFPNPERGFYYHYETSSKPYVLLIYDDLRKKLINDHISLILRLFYLDQFVDKSLNCANDSNQCQLYPIDQSYIKNMRDDFETLRRAGLKTVVRFAYTAKQDFPHSDAAKAQILAHLQQLVNENIFRDYMDVIAVVQAGFIGAWGEWLYTDHFANKYDEKDISLQQYQDRKDVLDKLLAALFPERMVQLRRPQWKQEIFQINTPLATTDAYGGTDIARTGYHNDCFVGSNSDMGTYLKPTEDRAYLAAETQYLPMGGETCQDTTTPTLGVTPTDRSLCKTAVDELEKYHWTYLNRSYEPSVLSKWEKSVEFPEGSGNFYGPCMDEIKRKLGYRFQLVFLTEPLVHGVYSSNVPSGDEFSIQLTLKNTGWAAPFNPHNVELILRNQVTQQDWAVKLSDDPRRWLTKVIPDPEISHAICTPAEMPPGNYDLFLNLPDPDPSLNGRPEYSIQLANENVWEGETGFNKLLYTISVTQSVSTTPCEGELGDHYVLTLRPDLMIQDTSDDRGIVPSHGDYVLGNDGLSQEGPWWESPAITINPGTINQDKIVIGIKNEILVTVSNRGATLPEGTKYDVCLGWHVATTTIPFPLPPSNILPCIHKQVGLGGWKKNDIVVIPIYWDPKSGKVPEGNYCLTVWVDTLGDRVRNTPAVNWDNNRAQNNVVFEEVTNSSSSFSGVFWIDPQDLVVDSSIELTFHYSPSLDAFKQVEIIIPPELEFKQVTGGDIIGHYLGEKLWESSSYCTELCSSQGVTMEPNCMCAIKLINIRGSARLEGIQVQELVPLEVRVFPAEEFAVGQFVDVYIVEKGILPGHEEVEPVGGLTIRFKR